MKANTTDEWLVFLLRNRQVLTLKLLLEATVLIEDFRRFHPGLCPMLSAERRKSDNYAYRGKEEGWVGSAKVKVKLSLCLSN
jgi:hypothetical protein